MLKRIVKYVINNFNINNVFFLFNRDRDAIFFHVKIKKNFEKKKLKKTIFTLTLHINLD